MTCSDTLTVDNIKDYLVNDTKIKVAAVDIDGVLRGKVMHKDKFLSVVEGGFGKSWVWIEWVFQEKKINISIKKM
jgi:glutamine synthetase